MLTLRPSNERGYFDFGWLKTHHSFSFADYHDPKHMGFRELRVINQDSVQAHTGFGLHSHNNMEIITYIVEGTVTHHDSMGNETIIKKGEIQLMSAGTGVQHSEYNRGNETLELLQIWIIPDRHDLKPSYQQISFDSNAQSQLLVSPQAKNDGVLHIHQNVKLFRINLQQGEIWQYSVADHRYLWLQLISGQIKCANLQLHSGDGLAVSEEKSITVTALQPTEFLLFDLN